VGRNVADIFAEGDNQGYVAFDTAWRDVQSVFGAPLCSALSQPNYVCIFNPLGPECENAPPGCGALFGAHGHRPPPEEVTVSGSLGKGGHFCVGGEPKCLPEELEESFPLGFAGKTDAVDLGFGSGFGAQNRVFEFDPDELIFAEHHSGHAYCPSNLDLRSGSTDFSDYVCDGEISLPAEE
jgi:hypothetical protein